ncbi:MAG TPA: radical SAM protein, partial [Terriglobia bacterium]|nr:radical SAM protein [Terriglobia bacterium]
MQKDTAPMGHLGVDEPKRRWNLDCEIVYGPISSRRFGYSLGINLLPSGQKVCDFDCLYCQCGWTPRSLVEQCFAGIPFPSLVDIKKVVDLQFRELASQDNQPDTIIFSGNGEPTLHPEFPRAVEEVERARDLYLPEARVGVLSNGSRLGESSVFQAVSGMDLKSVKFDAGGEWLDRPLMPYDLDALITTWHNLPNLTIQSFFSEGRFDNTGSRDVEPWLDGLTRIQPNRVQIYTLDRVPPVKLMRKASGETLRRLA